MYWEKVNFGMKPTIRINHAVIYNVKAQGRDISVVAIKQLYASHYFHTALDLTVCVADPSAPGGFYLLTLKGSEQDGLTGVKGSILRKVVVKRSASRSKARSPPSNEPSSSQHQRPNADAAVRRYQPSI